MTLVAVLIGAIYLKEVITLIQLLGGAFVLVGCVFILGLFGLGKEKVSA
ncbi:unannotated protein [freshwater metagenome]|uniref:Unannotated protein n=1 Tax=freshwater metagenome TaxID=449393 RepID=A0A6J7MFF9_9ZZZZ